MAIALAGSLATPLTVLRAQQPTPLDDVLTHTRLVVEPRETDRARRDGCDAGERRSRKARAPQYAPRRIVLGLTRLEADLNAVDLAATKRIPPAYVTTPRGLRTRGDLVSASEPALPGKG